MGIGRLITPLLVSSVVYYLMSVRVPEGFSEPWKLRLVDATVDIGNLIVWPVGLFDTTSEVQLLRFLMDLPLKLGIPVDPDLKVTDTTFDGVQVRVYEPAERKAASKIPGFVFYHGGGWSLGSIDSYDFITRHLAKSLNAVVVSVGYRMAPEHPFPGPFEDCLKATKHFLLHTSKYNVDPQRVAIGGDSAGGNLAAVVSIRLRDEDFQPAVKQQVLIYPGTQGIDHRLPSSIQNDKGPILRRYLKGYFWSMHLTGTTDVSQAVIDNTHAPQSVRDQYAKYLNRSLLPRDFLELAPYDEKVTGLYREDVWNRVKDDLLSPYLSPLLAEDLSRLPQAYVVTCHYDTIRDEGFLYAHRLKEEGNAVTYVNYKRGFHGLLHVSDRRKVLSFKEGEKILQDIIEYLQREL